MNWYDVACRCAWRHRKRHQDPLCASWRAWRVKADSPEKAAKKWPYPRDQNTDALIDVYEAAPPGQHGKTTGAHLGAFRVTSRRVVDVAPYTNGESQ